MDPNLQAMTANPQVSIPTSASPVSKPTLPRRANKRRPKVLPDSFKEKLANLGYFTRSNDTTDASLRELVDRLQTDFQRYKDMANHWQAKVKSLASSSDKRRGQAEVAASQEVVVHPGVTFPSVLAFEQEFLNRVTRNLNPSLHIHQINDSLARSAVAREQSAEALSKVLFNIHDLATLIGLFEMEGDISLYANPQRPIFVRSRAVKVWNDLFEPIAVPVSRLDWYASSSSRSDSLIDPDDGDYDHFDRVLMNATDEEVVEKLHYTAVLIVGLNHLIHDDPKYITVRDHMGKYLERLLREVMICRNVSAFPQHAQLLLLAFIASIWYFTSQKRFGMVMSLLEIAWSIGTQHIAHIEMATLGFVSFIASLTVTSAAKKALWLNRNQENLTQALASITAPQNAFCLTTSAHLAASYYSLHTHDEESLLFHLSRLDELVDNPSLAYPEHLVHDMKAIDAANTQARLSLKQPEINTFLADDDGLYSDNDSIFPQSISSETLSPPCSPQQSCGGNFPLEEKSFLTATRVSTHLLRAEAALTLKDHVTCRSWVDQAESELAVLTPMMLHVMIDDTNAVYASQSTGNCPFPSGSKTVSEEFIGRAKKELASRSTLSSTCSMVASSSAPSQPTPSTSFTVCS